MKIMPSAAIRQNYYGISVNGECDLVVMDVKSFHCREKMLELRESLLRVEEDRQMGRTGCSVDNLDTYLGDVLHNASFSLR